MRASRQSTSFFRAISVAVLVCAAVGAALDEAPVAGASPDWRSEYRSALRLMRGRQYAEAIGKLEECVKHGAIPAHSAAQLLTYIGRCQLHQRNYAGAEATLRRTARRNPRDHRPHYWLGKSCLLQNDTEGALKHFDEALRLNGRAHEVYWERAQLAAAAGNRVDEANELESFLRCCPGWSGGHAVWAKTRLFCEDVRQVAGAIERAAPAARPVSRVLVTGFGPFGRFTENPSWESLKGLEQSTIAGADVHAVLLPVHFLGATTGMREAIERVKPELVLAFGVGGRSCFGIETVARRPTKRLKPGTAGSPEEALTIDDPALPATYRTRLPVLYMIERLRQAGVPVSARDNAGRFLCNHIFYVAAHLLRETDIPFGFVHVPRYATDDPLLGGIEVSRHKAAMRLTVEAAIEGANAGYVADPLTPVLIEVLGQPREQYSREWQRETLLKVAGTGQR